MASVKPVRYEITTVKFPTQPEGVYPLVMSEDFPAQELNALMAWFVQKYFLPDSAFESCRVHNRTTIRLVNEKALFGAIPCRIYCEEDEVHLDRWSPAASWKPTHVALFRDDTTFMWNTVLLQQRGISAITISIGGIDDRYGIHMMALPVQDVIKDLNGLCPDRSIEGLLEIFQGEKTADFARHVRVV